MLLAVSVSASASQNQIVGWRQGRLKINVAAAAINGRANQELIRFLAKQLDLAPSLINITKGQTKKQKLLDVPLSLQEIQRKLAV